jgi:glycosyltransferase involved in cell wall biosynthesis
MYVQGLLFSKGGIERIAIQLANEFARRGHKVFIYCRIWQGKPQYAVDSQVSVVPVFDERRLPETALNLREALALQDLDVFVPMLSEWLFADIVKAAEGLSLPVIASEHNDPWQIEAKWWTRQGRLETFGKVDAVHLLLERFRPSLPSEFHGKTFVIPNGIELPDRLERPEARKQVIVAAGRLVPQKRFDRLIRAFTRVHAATRGSWTLEIYGEGEERKSLQSLIAREGLERVVDLCGVSDRLDDKMREASIFVLPSEFEGFGMVVLEAKRAGLPSVAYSDCNGPNELIEDGVDGILSDPDQDGRNLARAILRLVQDEALRARMGASAQSSLAQYDLQVVADRWEAMLLSVISGRRERIPGRRRELMGTSGYGGPLQASAH